jgi:hypothetical protein
MLILVLVALNLATAQNNFWQKVEEQNIRLNSKSRHIIPATYATFYLDIEQLKVVLQKAPNRYAPDADTDATKWFLLYSCIG